LIASTFSSYHSKTFLLSFNPIFASVYKDYS
jgi:hypothetical protein